MLDSLTYSGNPANIEEFSNNKKFNFIKGDIRDEALVLDITQSVDAVVNFAAESHVDRSISNPNIFSSTNLLGTQNLLNAIKKNKISQYLQVSTDEVYGSIDEGSWTEKYPISPNSPYSASKAAADLMCLAYFRTYETPVKITRSSNNYGPRQYPEKLIPLAITNLLEEMKVPIYGNGLNIRDWLHVEDHCAGIKLVLEQGRLGETYNIGGGRELTNIEIVKTILEALNFDENRIEFVEDRKGHDLRYSLDTTKARAELGYSPKIDFESGIQSTIDWYKNNAEWWKPLRRK